MNNLKPCPFCGSEAEIVDVCNDCFISGKVGIGCSKCPVIIAEYGEYKVFDNEAEAIEAWNKRAERTCHKTGRPVRGLINAETAHCSECGAEIVTQTNEYTAKYCFCCGARLVAQ